ncbi:hypothetical protein CEXT_676031 [Caerostris extrusa]|uniref:Uncharacterized protein n=1 Tax=Caerostris extrusa TaxID=172846 RepID=A0AAV4X210_CAEEX|nr:hypothetical protein CEXT_676031 [Caerostris extrusa]
MQMNRDSLPAGSGCSSEKGSKTDSLKEDIQRYFMSFRKRTNEENICLCGGEIIIGDFPDVPYAVWFGLSLYGHLVHTLG